jgi:hypothetical protein
MASQSLQSKTSRQRWLAAILIGFGGAWGLAGPAIASGTGQIELSVIDSETKEPVAVRMELRNVRGRPIPVRNAIKVGGQCCFDGTIVLDLTTGKYTFRMERGPEYRVRTGNFEIRRGATDNKQVDMQRFVDMAHEGWYSGDLDVDHRTSQLPTLMLAEDLRVAAIRGWQANRNSKHTPNVQSVGKERFFAENVAIDSRPIGRIGFCGLLTDISAPVTASETPSPFDVVAAVRRQATSHIDLATLTHADLPVWIASKQLDTVGLLNSNVILETVTPGPTIGRPGNSTIYAPPHGPGRWSLSTYYELLNCGLRIAPSAGSGSGTIDNPVGYNRVYVFCGDEFTWDNWWQGLRQGRSLVTNGPMMRAFVNGQVPGHVFRGYPGETVELETTLKLSTRESIAYLQIVKNGQTAAEVRLDELVKKQGELPKLKFTESGWMMIRAVCDNPKALRYATTAPYYVEFDGKPRISRRSCEFFVDWTMQRVADLEKNLKPSEHERVLRYHRAAQKYWNQKLSEANAP